MTLPGWNQLVWWRLRRQLNDVQLLVLDVDGVLTDGGLWFDAEGQLIKRFDVRDGLGIRLLQQAGVQIAFLSGGRGGATEVPTGDRSLSGRHQGQTRCPANPPAAGGQRLSNLFVGDDLNDLAVRPVVGLLFAPADACAPVRRAPIWCSRAAAATGPCGSWRNGSFKPAMAGAA